MITAIGGLLLPISLWFWRRPAALLILVLLYSAFSAAALVVVGGFGVRPALLPATMFIGLFLIHAVNGIRYPAERQALRLLFPFAAVICGALISSVIMPRLFEDQVLVWPQKVTGYFMRSPLAPNAGNFTQDMYLLADALLTVTAALYLTRTEKLMGRLLDIYFISGVMVACISLWQLCSNMLHLPFPTQFFHSNPGWAQASDETMGWFTRLNGPFSEPSVLSSYMCASLSAGAWAILNGDRRILPQLAFWGGLAVVLLTTASTGYLTLLIMSILLALHTIFIGRRALRRRVMIGLALILILGGGVMGGIASFAPDVAREVQLVADSTLNKTHSSSYQIRSTADIDSLKEMRDTYGLGVGWGSNRSSSLLPGLCAAIGLWGVAGLAWFAILLGVNVRRAIRLTRDPELHHVIRVTSAALISVLVSSLLSGPTIDSPDFYLLLGMLVAAAARAKREVLSVRGALPVTRFRRAEQMSV